MTGRQQVYQIPEFHSIKDAQKWAFSVGWIEPLRRQVRDRAAWYRAMGELEGDPTVYQIDMARYYHSQADYYEAALAVIERFKKANIKGDESKVGACFYAGSVPL